MPQLNTAGFGTIDYDANSVIRFPAGLPAFEDERDFLLIEKPETVPVLFLQSLKTPELAFLTLPVLFVNPSYHPVLEPEDAAAVDLPAEFDLQARDDIGCLGIVTIAEGGPPTVNLMAPVVINWSRRLAVQAIQSAARYSHQHPLELQAAGDASC